MKKIILMIVILPNLAFAQFNKGSFFLGGSISGFLQNADRQVSATSSNVQKYNSISFTPSIGFFLKDRIVIGANVGYSTSFREFDYFSNNNNAYQKTTSYSYGLGSFVRYYMPISNSVYFALQGQLAFDRASSKFVSYNGITETRQENPFYDLGANIKPVLIFFPSPNWGIEASVGSLGYTRTQYLTNNYVINNLGLSAGSFTLGLTYYFRK